MQQTSDFTSGPVLKMHEELVDVILIFLPRVEKEYVPNVKVLMRADGAIDFCELLKNLKAMSFPIEKNTISYYSYTNDMYIHCGNDPIASNSYIPARDVGIIGERKQVTVRVRQVVSDIPTELPPENPEQAEVAEDGEKGRRRMKERKISEIVEKVLQWRRLYQGVIDPATGQPVKMSLEEAANRVGITKKSLDDYQLQIKFGKLYGFNFNDNHNQKVGVLRAFVKKYKSKGGKKDKDTGDKSDNEDLDDVVKKKTKTGK